MKCSFTEKGWVSIEKVLERNTHQIIGRVEKLGKKHKAIPINLGRFFSIELEGDIPKTTSLKNLANIKITQQPSFNNSAKGVISKLFQEEVETRAIEIAISKYDINPKWSKGIINETRRILKHSQREKHSRRDLRDKAFVTIDGKNAKDFDDAVYAEEDKKGNLSLYVAIADVAKFVRPNTLIDDEARARGTSIYFTKKVIPMLPELISNELCSLKLNEDKYCLVFKINFSKEGSPSEALFFEGLIRSKARLTYEDISHNFEENNFYGEYADSLRNLKRIFIYLKKRKRERGALELAIPSYKPNFKNGRIKNFLVDKHFIAHSIIEECMLIANISASKIISKSCLPAIYRVHPKPEYSSIKQLEQFLRSRGINLKLEKNIKVKQLSLVLEKVKDSKHKEMISLQILQSLNIAIYHQEISEHFALGF